VFGELISLNEIHVECIQDLNEISFGSVSEVWPVEAICHVKLINALSSMSQLSGRVLHA